MLNKKGMTLVEIIVSIGLISIVMIYLFNLLIDIQYESNHPSYAKDNMITRATIIKTIQKDLLDNELYKIDTFHVNNSVMFTFLTKENTIFGNMTVTENSITYNDETWLLDSNNEDEIYDIENIKLNTSPTNTCTYTLNVDSDGDGVCNYNCDTNKNGILDSSELSTANELYKACSDYQYIHLIIPVVTGATANIIDDLDIFYIGKVS